MHCPTPSARRKEAASAAAPRIAAVTITGALPPRNAPGALTIVVVREENYFIFHVKFLQVVPRHGATPGEALVL